MTGRTEFPVRIERAPDRIFHIGLARAEQDIADMDILREHLIIGLQRERTGGSHWREGCRPLSVSIDRDALRKTRKAQLNFASRLTGTSERNRRVALNDHIVAKGRVNLRTGHLHMRVRHGRTQPAREKQKGDRENSAQGHTVIPFIGPFIGRRSALSL